MEYRLLGKSDLLISRIGFGTMSLEPAKPDTGFLIHQAIDQGINFFDTADLYQHGKTEELLGRVLKTKRSGIILATKAGNQWRADGSGWDWNPSKNHILSALESSLRRLQTDYIVLFQLHGGTIEDPIDDIIDVFEKLKISGKIRHYGISSIRPNVIREYVLRSKIASVMMQYSLLDRRPEEEVFPLLIEQNIGVLARGAIAKGLLVSKPAEPFLNYSSHEVKKIYETLCKLKGGKESSYYNAMGFVLSESAVTSAVIGIRTINQLEDAIKVFAKPAMSDEELQTIRQFIPASKYIEHR